jgi:ketosteroid isomerase-like protein
MILRPASLACTILALAALGLGACGSSDEDEIRSLTTKLQRLQQSKDTKGVCDVMTPRARAQATAVAGLFSGATGDCAALLAQTEQSDDQPGARDVNRAKVRIRGDQAVLTYRTAGDGTLGYRKVDGTWRVDNLLNARLDEPPRKLDAALSRGSDEAQIRATYKAGAAAFSRSDFRRACDLMSYEAEAQLVVGAAFTMFGQPASEQQARSISCIQALRRIDKLAGDQRPFGAHTPTSAEVEAARVSIRGANATVRVPGDEAQEFVRRDGHWLIGPDRQSISVSEPPSADALAACWKRAGALIARTKRNLRFASVDEVRATKLSPGRASVKGADWRIFYTLQADHIDPGLSAILADPSIVKSVAYVKDAPAQAATVKHARKCGSGA